MCGIRNFESKSKILTMHSSQVSNFEPKSKILTMHSSRKSAILSQTVRLYTQTVPKLPPKTSLVSCWTTSKKKSLRSTLLLTSCQNTWSWTSTHQLASMMTNFKLSSTYVLKLFQSSCPSNIYLN